MACSSGPADMAPEEAMMGTSGAARLRIEASSTPFILGIFMSMMTALKRPGDDRNRVRASIPSTAGTTMKPCRARMSRVKRRMALVIVDDQDAAPAPHQYPPGGNGGRAGGRSDGNVDTELGALPDDARNLDESAVASNDPLRRCEAEARAAPPGLGREERLEYPLDVLRRHSPARVRNRDHREFPRMDPRMQGCLLLVHPAAFGPHADDSAARHRVARVDGKIEQDLLELRHVTLDGSRIPRQIEAELDVPGEGLVDQLRDSLEEVAHGHVGPLALDTLHEGQQLADDARAPVGRVFYQAQVLAGRGTGHVELQQLDAQEHGREDVVQVVRNPARQHAYALEPLRAHELRLEPLALRHVLLDGNIVADRAGGIPHRSYRHLLVVEPPVLVSVDDLAMPVPPAPGSSAKARQKTPPCARPNSARSPSSRSPRPP